MRVAVDRPPAPTSRTCRCVFSSALTDLLISFPVALVFDLVAPTLGSTMAAGDSRKAVGAYNQDLELRVRRAAAASSTTPSTTAPSTTTPPPAPAEPAAVDPPAAIP